MAFSFFFLNFFLNHPFFHTNKSVDLKSCISSWTTTNDNSATVLDDFDNPINQADEECEEEAELPEELPRLLKPEEIVIQPHEESVEVINLGT